MPRSLCWRQSGSWWSALCERPSQAVCHRRCSWEEEAGVGSQYFLWPSRRWGEQMGWIICLLAKTRIFVSASRQRYAPMDMFLIYFGSATFDQIKKDTKMTMETMVGWFCSTLVTCDIHVTYMWHTPRIYKKISKEIISFDIFDLRLICTHQYISTSHLIKY